MPKPLRLGYFRSATATLDPLDYTVAWIAPLEIEAQAALQILDHRHSGRFQLARGDDYVFQPGDINGHNVVVATLPKGSIYGISSASALTTAVRKFFPNLWFGLLVGVAAGLPNLSKDPPLDIRLGDILVGVSTNETPGLVAYGLGKETGSDGFQQLRGGHPLAETEVIVRSAYTHIRLAGTNEADTFLQYYDQIKDKKHDSGTFADPGQKSDKLYQLEKDGEKHVVKREKRPAPLRTRVHYGSIGSGDTLMKSAQKRDELRDKHNIIGLEMEAAGVLNQLAAGVIRGVCDYGDEHKNKIWQPYAAAMAAAYAKAVLYAISPKPPVLKSISLSNGADESLEADEGASMEPQCVNVPSTVQSFIARPGTVVKIEDAFKRSQDRPEAIPRIGLRGIGGSGKTQLAASYCCDCLARKRYDYIIWFNASNRNLLDQQVKQVTQQLGLSKPEAADKLKDNEPLSVLRDLLQHHTGAWLMIFDEFDNPGDFENNLDPYLPDQPLKGHGCVLVTSRISSYSLEDIILGPVIDVEQMEPSEAEQLMRVRSGSAAVETESSDLDIEEPRRMRQLLKQVGYHAFTVDILAAHIRKGFLSTAQFIRELRHDSDNDPLNQGNASIYHIDTPRKVCEMALTQVDQHEDVSKREAFTMLLAICARLGDYPIRKEWLLLSAKEAIKMKEIRPWMVHFMKNGNQEFDSYKFDAALTDLLDRSIIKKSSEDNDASLQGTFTMHQILRRTIEKRGGSIAFKNAQLDAVSMLFFAWEKGSERQALVNEQSKGNSSAVNYSEDVNEVYQPNNLDLLGPNSKELEKFARSTGYRKAANIIMKNRYWWKVFLYPDLVGWDVYMKHGVSQWLNDLPLAGKMTPIKELQRKLEPAK
ncbi:MAG: hypothetical protein M1820_010405 [Bogoriella megaspora]|nr:MAG: hypothetical protein M1820_010405 [Bogoriella megaspora]